MLVFVSTPLIDAVTPAKWFVESIYAMPIMLVLLTQSESGIPTAWHLIGQMSGVFNIFGPFSFHLPVSVRDWNLNTSAP